MLNFSLYVFYRSTTDPQRSNNLQTWLPSCRRFLAYSSVAENSDLGSSAGLNTSDKCLAWTLSNETLDYESMMSALDIGGNNLGSSQALSPSNNFSKSVFKLAVDECKDVVLPPDNRVLFTGNILCELC